MTTVPIGTVDPDEYDPTVTIDDEADRALARALSGRSIWVDRDILSAKIRLERFLPYLAGVNRASNITRQWHWDPGTVAADCGSNKPKAFQGLPAVFAEAGLLEKCEPRPGQKTRVVFPKVDPKRRLRAPLDSIWDSNGDLFWGTETAKVVRWILIINKVGRWHRHGLVITCDISAPEIAKRAGVSLSDYRRCWTAARQALADVKWMTWSQTEREDGGLDALEVVLDWTRLKPSPRPESTIPTFEHPPGFRAEGVRTFEQGSITTSEQGVSLLSNDLYKEGSALESVLENAVLPSSPQRPTDADASPAAHLTSQREEEGSPTKISTKAEWVTTADARDVYLALRPIISDAGSRAAIPDDTWLAVVVANIVHDNGTRTRLPMNGVDVRSLASTLLGLRAAGWDPIALAENLTADSNEVANVRGVLTARIKRLNGIEPLPPAGVDDTAVWSTRQDPSASAATWSIHQAQRDPDFYNVVLL